MSEDSLIKYMTDVSPATMRLAAPTAELPEAMETWRAYRHAEAEYSRAMAKEPNWPATCSDALAAARDAYRKAQQRAYMMIDLIAAHPEVTGLDPATAEEIQRIAIICGEIDMTQAAGINQISAIYRSPADGKVEMRAVQPEKVVGIYRSIWLRLKERPEFSPWQAATSRAERAERLYARAHNALRQISMIWLRGTTRSAETRGMEMANIADHAIKNPE